MVATYIRKEEEIHRTVSLCEEVDLPDGHRSAVRSPSSRYYERPLVRRIQWVKRIYEGVSEGLDEADQEDGRKGCGDCEGNGEKVEHVRSPSRYSSPVR